jgi:sulfite reductase (NADPH) flavoprotein alpha-component
MVLEWGSTAARQLAAAGVVLTWLLVCGGIWRARWRAHRRHAAPRRVPGGTPPVLVAYASQTGFGEQLARQTAEVLHTAGVSARLLALSSVTADDLVATERALFIASTCGEGDAPDNASLFVRRLMAGAASLPSLHYGVLALGDRGYKQFCGFGRALDAWLGAAGASPLFERIEVDNANDTALADWHHRLSHLAGTSDLPDWQAPAWEPWRLIARSHLNPGSAGGPTYHLELEPASGERADWASGDLVQVRAPGDPQRPREYSIASVPADGRVHLLVRQECHPDGTLGVASGWLTHGAAVGGTIDLRLRRHANFRLGDNAVRPLILIGNGTGLAGLRGHLRAQAAKGGGRCWLVFGERQAAFDAYYRDEIEAWQADGLLARTDLVFSRDQAERLYVQDRLRGAAQALRHWVDQGAAVYVCGSLQGMASGVDAALVEVLGRPVVDGLLEQGRYRRDVY